MSKAILRGIRLSPKKSRLIARQVQGMNGEYALATLEFTPNKAAKIIYKVLASAIANGDFQPEEVTVLSCRVDEGPVLKRFRPRARGSASKIRKPTAHITVIVGEHQEEKKETSKAKKVEAKTSKSAVKDVASKPKTKVATKKTTDDTAKQSTAKTTTKSAEAKKPASKSTASKPVAKSETKTPTKPKPAIKETKKEEE